MKFILKGIGFILSLALLSGFAPVTAQTPEPVHLKQADLLTTTLAPVLVAIQKGYMADEGIDLEYIPLDNGRMSAPTLLSGQAQFTDLTVADVIDLQKQGKDPVLVYNLANSVTSSLVVRNEVLAKLGVSRQSPLLARERALKGLTIGVTSVGALSDLYVRWLARQGGLDPEKDLNIIAVGNGVALVAALEAGQIDAYLQSPPAPFNSIQNGTGSILIMISAGDVPQFKDFAYNSIAVSRAWAQQHPDIVEGYSRALDKAYAFLFKHTDEAIDLIHAGYFPDSDMATFRPSVLAILQALKADGTFTEQAVKNQVTVLRDIGTIEEAPDTSEGVIWTNKWNPETLTNQILPTVEAFDGSMTETPTAETTAAP